MPEKKTREQKVQSLKASRDELVDREEQSGFGIASNIINALSPALALINPLFALAGKGVAKGVKSFDTEGNEFAREQALNETLLKELAASELQAFGLEADAETQLVSEGGLNTRQGKQIESDKDLAGIREGGANERLGTSIAGQLEVEDRASENQIKEEEARAAITQRMIENKAKSPGSIAELEDQTAFFAQNLARLAFAQAENRPTDPAQLEMFLNSTLLGLGNETGAELPNTQEIVQQAIGLINAGEATSGPVNRGVGSIGALGEFNKGEDTISREIIRLLFGDEFTEGSPNNPIFGPTRPTVPVDQPITDPALIEAIQKAQQGPGSNRRGG